MKKILSIIGAIVGVIYLLNPTSGIIEIIPDNLPIVGNLDEVGAVLLVVACLKEFGVDIFEIIKRK